MKSTPADIDGITAFAVSVPMIHGFLSARSRVGERHVLLIRVDSGGRCGWGEAAPVPGHTAEQVSDLWIALRKLLDAHGTDAPATAAGMLAAAFNQAGDDLAARLGEEPLWRMLGGDRKVSASAAIGIGRDGQPDVAQVDAAAASGYRNAKLKITPRTEPQKVADLIDRYPTISFGVDANGSLGLTERTLLAALDNLPLAYIEQPGAATDLDLHARFRQQLQTPVALDESAFSPEAIEQILAVGAADIINLKAGRFGTAATLRLAKRVAASGVAVRLGGLLETGIGRAHSVALASHPVFGVPGDIAGSERYFADDLVRPQWRVSNGYLCLPDRPGIGVEIDPESLDRHTAESLSVG